MLKVYLNPAAQFLRVFWKLSVFVKFPLPELFVENSNRMQVLHHIYLAILLKSVSMRKPGRTRQGVIMPKSPISLKLGTNVRYQELTYVTESSGQNIKFPGRSGHPL